MNSIRLSLAVATVLATAIVSSHAQDVTATLSWVAEGNSYDYTVTLKNTGSVALNSFWYGWTTSGDNLSSEPSSAGNSTGWANTVSGNSIQWVNTSYSYYGYTYYYGTSLEPGASATFTFVSSSTPAEITASPSGESVAYVGAIDFSQGNAGDSTAVFSPALVSGSNSPPLLAVTVNRAGSGPAAPNSIVLTWPATVCGLTLQSTTNLVAPVAWTNVSLAPVVVNGQNTVTNTISGAQQFFRLANP